MAAAYEILKELKTAKSDMALQRALRKRLKQAQRKEMLQFLPKTLILFYQNEKSKKKDLPAYFGKTYLFQNQKYRVHYSYQYRFLSNSMTPRAFTPGVELVVFAKDDQGQKQITTRFQSAGKSREVWEKLTKRQQKEVLELKLFALLTRMQKSYPKAMDDITRMIEVVFPQHLNHQGNLFGGQALRMMDTAAFIAATRRARRTMMTVAVENVQFIAPVRHGEIVELEAKVSKTGTTSATVDIEMFAEELLTGQRRRCGSARYVFVAVGEDGQKIPIA